MTTTQIKEPITLMLLGGGVRFPAFIGALRAIEKKGLSITKIIGSSTGSIIGSLYALGVTPAEMEAETMSLDTGRFKDFSMRALVAGKGFYQGKALESWVDERLGGRTFGDQFRIRPAVIATDILNYRPLIFSAEQYPDVKIATAVRGSVGVPGVFACREFSYNGTKHLLVDGSLMAGVVERMYDTQGKTLILKVVSKRTLNRPSASVLTLKGYFLELLNFSLHAMEKEFIKGAKWRDTIMLYCADIPPVRFSLTETEKEYLIEQGYEQTMKYLEYKWGI